MSAAQHIEAGRLSTLERGAVRVIPLPSGAFGVFGGSARAKLEALLVRDLLGEPRAYLNRCRHLPIPLAVGATGHLSDDGAALECRTHGARYHIDDGVCFDGPCVGLALTPIALHVAGDLLYLVLPEPGQPAPA